MSNILIIIGAVGLTVQVLIGLSYLISCIWEKELRATLFAFLQFLGMTTVLIVYLLLIQIDFFQTDLGLGVLVAGYVVTVLGAVLLLRKTRPNSRALKGAKGYILGDVKRQDEREIVFARNRSLKPDSEQYHAFYKAHPEYKAYDDARRGKGGPMGNTGAIDRPHEALNVAALLASTMMPHHLSGPEQVRPAPHPALEKGLEKGKVRISPEEATRRIKGYARKLGASLVGITQINPLWVYSHRGEIYRENWEDWGKEIPVAHKYAVVFADEMALDMVGTAPHTPTSIESIHNYSKGAFVATQLAAFIANLGYSATANHLRHYEAMMVPLAIDAGLGELSRMGYLITKELGPRVRISAVFTDLPLVPDRPVDIGVEDFCRICKKCSVCCPSKAIPMEDQMVVNHSLRWVLNSETCFEYWGKIGTDCNVCMRVCPWSHARTFPHRLIVFMISRNALVRRIFSVMDDIFYGKKPKPLDAPEWVRFDGNHS